MFVLTVAAAEAAIGLAILVVFFRNRGTSPSKTSTDEGLSRMTHRLLPQLGAIVAGVIALFAPLAPGAPSPGSCRGRRIGDRVASQDRVTTAPPSARLRR